MAAPEERFLSTEEVAERLQVDEQTVRRWIKSGKLEAVKPGREWRIPPAAFEALLENHGSPKVQAPLPLELKEQHGADGALAAKLDQQLETQLRVLRERQNSARSDEDLHEAAKDFQHWWVFTADWLTLVLLQHPEDRGPKLEEVVDRASQAVRDEFPKDASNPKNVPDMANIVSGWAAQQDANARQA